eukprot:m.118300 g.118300  ORF g.118300 m.118300 type:complete len:260 (-) comp19503_c0_seq1:42-821(-)
MADAIESIFIRCISSDLNAAESEYTAQLFLELLESRPPKSEPELRELVLEALDSSSADEERAEAIVAELCLKPSLLAVVQRRHPPPVADLDVPIGAEVLAVLAEDQEWHPAKVTAYSEGQFNVLFSEYNKEQPLSRDQMVLMEDLAEEDAAGEEGTCLMCGHCLKLTRHHLIPRTTHPKYLKKGYTKEFLNTCIDICRRCHSAVHRLYPEAVLASTYHTLELLLQDPQVQRWIAYAKTSHKTTKWDMQLLRSKAKSLPK